MEVPHYIGRYKAEIELPIVENVSPIQIFQELQHEVEVSARSLAMGQKQIGTPQHQRLQHAFFTFLIVTAVTEHGTKKAAEKPEK